MTTSEAHKRKCWNCGNVAVHKTHDESRDWEYDNFINEPDEDCCPRCGGSGEVPTESFESYTGDNYNPCPECGGRG